ncbi:MAG TPA: type II toxin-antitoxin system MqsA family antitoxin [Spirochaetota bacterium]|nr:type II toxin-antitoxin system MqsA family antitoxin [Spirochaetota bacterium]HPC42657.1 type II toxin-antitoxin system MqsA family antitoxin [Spirochaetota bacterium]HPL16248.1 type II toxin-antitoxin system MqsA family antitoxin [Spirochaetota bacterium]HQF08423.1 type II toxin-antitoxin system MqsA family antitoxin [Spirochaetota bacterium]HQH99061.1 type II toxin-antitoxin system MqsA family antitoxin [Spirochaetota bacterium]
MKCSLCKNGETKPDLVTISLNKNETVVVIKNVPAEVCSNCGEYYLSTAVTNDILKKAEMAASKGVEVEIIKYVA